VRHVVELYRFKIASAVAVPRLIEGHGRLDHLIVLLLDRVPAYQRRLSFEPADPDDDRKRRLSLRPVGDRLYARSKAHVLHTRGKRPIRLTDP
jgi:hypothetical protein